tara:strand:+ start:37 stop:303 length:267 start_codon:yes stop_codon:yes gene_type:complete
MNNKYFKLVKNMNINEKDKTYHIYMTNEDHYKIDSKLVGSSEFGSVFLNNKCIDKEIDQELIMFLDYVIDMFLAEYEHFEEMRLDNAI